MSTPLWAAWSGIALTIFMAGVLAGYMIARAASERRAYGAEIDGYEGRHAERAPLPIEAAWPQLPAELEAPKSQAPAPAASIGQLQGAWPRPARLIIVGGSQRSRYPLEHTGRMHALTDTGEIRAIEATAEAARDAMRADNAAWLEAWAGAAP